MKTSLLYCRLFVLTVIIFQSTFSPGISMEFLSGKKIEWEFFSDQVMGGVSDGELSKRLDNDSNFYRMTGFVTTKNNGGFIQFRTKVNGVASDIEGITLKVRGNGEKYYIFVRTSGTFLPWQYYSIDFFTNPDWASLKLPLKNFQRSSGFLRRAISPDTIKSVGVVAYGREHEVLIDVADLQFY